MKTRLLSLLCAGAMILTLAGCMTLRASENLTKGLTPNTVDTAGAKTDEGARAAAQFALKLFAEALKSEEENVALSPLSAYFALAMVANGAKGDTLAEFTDTLGGGLEMADINLFCRALADRLTRTAGSTKLSLANSVWTDKTGFVPNQDFLQTVVDYFGAEVFTTDFKDPKAVTDINKWIEDKTKGLIKDMLKDLSPDTVMALVNTLYMKARWAIPFEKAETYKNQFAKADGTKVETPFMSRTGKMQYLSTDTAEGVLLPYDDERLGFVALLPKEGKSPADVLASMSDVKALIDGAQETSVRLSLPSFKIAYECKMNEILQAMGINLAFDEGRADLSGLGSAAGNLFIGRVLQKVVIEVSEAGTEAAAATVIEIRTTSAPLGDVTLTFDRPFVYMVVDLDSGLPLFIGQMDNPA